MKSNKVTMTGPWKVAALTSKNIPSETMKEASIAELPITPPSVFGILFQKRPLIRNPINGNSGTK
jgi:hypothetical protein